MAKLNALKRIGDYDGSTDIEQWLDRLEAAMRIDKIDLAQEADIIVMRLEGAARTVWKNISTAKQLDADTIKQNLRQAFGLQKFEAWRKVNSIQRIQAGNSIDAEFNQIKSLLTRAAAGQNQLEQIATCMLMDRLPEYIRSQVLMQCGGELESVLGCAKSIMSNSSHSTTSHEVCKVTAAAVVPHRGQDGNRDNAKSSSWRDRTSSSTVPICWRCGKSGHVQRFCRNSAQGNASGDSGAPTEFPRN